MDGSPKRNNESYLPFLCMLTINFALFCFSLESVLVEALSNLVALSIPIHCFLANAPLMHRSGCHCSVKVAQRRQYAICIIIFTNQCLNKDKVDKVDKDKVDKDKVDKMDKVDNLDEDKVEKVSKVEKVEKDKVDKVDKDKVDKEIQGGRGQGRKGGQEQDGQVGQEQDGQNG